MGQPLNRNGTITQSLRLLVAIDRNGRNFVTKNLKKPLDANWENKNVKCKMVLFSLGLGRLQSLQTVRLSSNGIGQIDASDFQNCSQLKDIHLQNNKITKIHPDTFRDLNKLQVVKQ